MSNTNTYNLGDTVKLKSGGPDMSVKELITNMNSQFEGTYRCQWFAEKLRMQGTRHRYPTPVMAYCIPQYATRNSQVHS